MLERRENRRQLDDVTGLYNMGYFMEEAQYMVRGSGEGSLAFIYFDIENFKDYNQYYGFQAGNEFLRSMAKRLKEAFPDGILARLHEDHFVVVVLNESIVPRIERVQEKMHGASQASSTVVVKAGIYVPDAGVTDIALILDRVKLACDSIKRLYDQYWCYFDESVEEKQRLRKYIASHFQTALQNGEIQVYYQPEVRVLTREICGFEALARWIDPNYGMISPGVFVEVLEEAHLSDKLDLYIVRKVCEDFAEVRAKAGEGWNLARISVNLSRMDFLLQDMFAAIEEIREETGTLREQLHIEVTESALNEEMLHETLDKFRKAGYEIWMDDFGSGYSSLNNLMVYDFDVLKIDMQFLRNFDKNLKTRTILKGIVNLAKELGTHTIAEGVETEEQFAFLRSIGCEMVQGYLFGKPAPLAEAAESYAGENARLKFEPFRLASYYKDIGTLNVLSSFPFMKPEVRRDQQNDIALAVLEYCSDARTRCLYANREFESFLISVGVSSTEEMERQFTTNSDQRMSHNFQRMVQHALETDEEQMSDVVVNGNLCNIRLKCLAYDPDGQAVAMAVIAANNSASAQGRQAAYDRLAMQHLLKIYTRVDLFNDAGTARNLYVDASQERVADVVPTNRGSVLAYAQSYIKKGERWRFCCFYNIRTVKKRIDASHMDHLSALFHTRNDYGDTRLELYVIIPFHFNGMAHYLSLVRDVSRAEKVMGLKPGSVYDHQ